MNQTLRRLAPHALAAVSVLFLVSGPVLGGPHDEEEYRNAVLSVVLHARALVEGVYPYWTSSLGFGLPLPMNPAFLIHPLMPLFGILPIDVAVRIMYVVHAALGAAGCWWLVRSLGAGPWAAALAASTWALSAPSQNYALTDFWIAEFAVWSFAPYLLLFATRVLDTSPARQRWIDAVAFGLVAGLIWANGHAGYVPVFFVPLAVMFLADWNRLRRAWPAIALATCVGLAVAAPTLAQLLTEVSRFGNALQRSTSETIFGPQHVIDLVLRPLSLSPPPEMLLTVFQRGTRVPFFGGPMFLLTVAYLFGFFKETSYRRPLAIAFASAFLLMLLPGAERIGVLTGTFLFRDSMILFGIVIGSLAWQAMLDRRAGIAWTVAALQIGALFLAAWPFEQQAYNSRRFTDTALHHTSTTLALRDWAGRLPGRWYLAPELDRVVQRQRLFYDGLWINVWVYRELPVVNGVFKGVSADEMFPSRYMPYGRVDGHAATVRAAATLDVLGVGAVLALADEPVGDTLHEVARFAMAVEGEIRLMRNPGVWPGAAFIDAGVAKSGLKPLPDCDVRGVLCLDFTPVTTAPHDTNVQLHRASSGLIVRFPPAAFTRQLLISEMYRPGWTARSGTSSFAVAPLFQGLIGLEVPPGVDHVELRFRPALRVVLTWTSFAAVLLSVSILLLAATNRSGPARHLAELLARYVNYHLPREARVVEYAPRKPYLVEALARSAMRVVFPSGSHEFNAPALSGWDEFDAFQPDRVVLNGAFHFEPDIQSLLDRLRTTCHPGTRVIAVYYSTLWRPFLMLGWHLGLTTTRPDHNWVTPSDVENLFRLTGFEVITTSQHILLPVRIPLLSAFINRWLAPLPVVRWLALINLAVARVVPASGSRSATVSVVVPARNERGNIASIVERIPPMGPGDEIIFVEGHSDDGTWEEIQSVVARHPNRRIRALRQPGRGKGDAVRAAFSIAGGDVLMILDADMTVAPEDLPKFYRALVSGTGEFINGSRLVYPMEREAMRFANMVGNKFFALAFTYLLGQPLKDTLCGTKVLTREHYEQIARERLYFGDFDPFGDFDLLFGAAKLGLRIVELPIRYRERTYGTTNIRRWAHGWLLLRMTAFAARKMKFI